MNFLDQIPTDFEISRPFFDEKAFYLNTLLKNTDKNFLKQIMGLSDKLLPQVVNTIRNFSGCSDNTRQAIFAYRGAVYKAINANSFDIKQMDFAQNHLRIISGLYGMLKPLDGIEEYRLEMKTKLFDTSNLYGYWKDLITNYLTTMDNSQVIINLASNEYSRVIDFSKINLPVIDFYFGEITENQIKFPPMYSKIARGKMSGYIIRNLLTEPEKIKNFNIDNYCFDSKLSTKNKFIFTR